MMLNDEKEKCLKSVVAYLKVLCRHSSGHTEEQHCKLKSGYRIV